MQTDYNALFWHKWHIVVFCLRRSISTLYMRLKCHLMKVKLGKNVVFDGTAFIQRTSNSSINIGEYGQFRSYQMSNTIGVNHPCSIATMMPNASLCIGNNFGASGVTINCYKSIQIGNNVRVGANSVILDGDGHMDDVRVGNPRPGIIEDGVWLGYGVIVMKGVHIGENTIIGAGSVVTKDIPANVVAAGNPCKVIKPLERK